MKTHICGIQQVGVGTDHLHRDWKWYRDVFGMDIRIFEDAAEAPLMTRYTGGKVHKRNAALAMNIQGGGGFEIWQYESRTPLKAAFDLELGDIGMVAVKMKTPNAAKALGKFKQQGVHIITALSRNSASQNHFVVTDNNGNWFDIVESANWFKIDGRPTGGAYGAIIGVSNMDKSLAFYRDMLGFDTVLSDTTGIHTDLNGIPGSNRTMRRVILAQSSQDTGPFTPLLGENQIELLQWTGGSGRKIFEGRYWGDQGFIHLCFDVVGMSALKEKGQKLNYPFTVDSADSFDMGKAAGRFSYVEDPDSTLIEFVETHRLPIVEKWGWYINLKKRKPGKPLPNWLLNCFKFNKIKA